MASRRSAFAAITLESDGPQSSQRADSPAEVGEFPQVLVHLNSRLGTRVLGDLGRSYRVCATGFLHQQDWLSYFLRGQAEGTLLIVPMVDVVELIRC